MLMIPSLRARMDITEIITIFSYKSTDLYRMFCINKSNDEKKTRTVRRWRRELVICVNI